MADLYFIADDRWREIIKIWMTEKRCCTKCGTDYLESDNIGKWQCMQHCLPWNGSMWGKHYGPFRWDCCGSTRHVGDQGSPSGCIRSDHTLLNAPYTEVNDVPIPFNLVNYIGAYRESVLEKGDPSEIRKGFLDTSRAQEENVVVRRFDWKDAASRMETGKTIYNKVVEVQGFEYDLSNIPASCYTSFG
jgi:hypothetical protein